MRARRRRRAPRATVPPCDSATWRTIARPSPEPGMPRASRRAVEAVEDVREVLVGDAGPVVADRSPRRRARATSTAPPGGAPLGGVVEQVRDRAVEPVRRRRGRPTPRARSRTSTSGAWRRARSTASATRRSRRTSSTSSCGLAVAGEVDERRATSAVSSSSWSIDVGEQPLALVLGASVSPAPSTSTFVRRLVSGVRSSCEASATSWRCARDRVLERARASC